MDRAEPADRTGLIVSKAEMGWDTHKRLRARVQIWEGLSDPGEPAPAPHASTSSSLSVKTHSKPGPRKSLIMAQENKAV
jgi:hypothetical protein